MLTTAAVAEELGVSPRLVTEMIRRGDLRGARVGRTWRVRQTDLDAFLDRQTTGPIPAVEATA